MQRVMKLSLLLALYAFPSMLFAQQHDSLMTWFSKMEWFKQQTIERTYDAFGRVIEEPSKAANADIKPHSSANIEEFAKEYHANPSRWNKAFAYLRNTDFSDLPEGRYEIDGTDVFAVIALGPPKSADSTRWESHRNYNDIHYVISGKEQIGIAPLAVARPVGNYIADRDITYYTANGTYYLADPGTFFIITTHEAHQPGIRADGYDKVKKLYIKVKRN